MARKNSESPNINPVFEETVLTYLKPEMAQKYLTALKKGEIPWQETLNLSNFNLETAKESLTQFIKSKSKVQECCVRIIHGLECKGGKLPLIKNLVAQWLPQFEEVLAFHSAQVKDGGTAALYVILKKVPSLPAFKAGGASFLADETKSMERKRRLAEQQGERKLAPVKAREHAEEDLKQSPEGELQNSILQHPELDNQRFDGIDPNLNPEPPLNSEARREFDNERREQDKEKQLRLGNMPKFTSTPTPRGP